jgi:hypothetical protein
MASILVLLKKSLLILFEEEKLTIILITLKGAVKQEMIAGIIANFNTSL